MSEAKGMFISMEKSIKFKERALGILDTLSVVVMVLLYFILILLIFLFVHESFKSRHEMAVSIIVMIIFVLPLAILFYCLSRILFSIFFQKNDKLDGLVINRKEFPQLYKTIDEIRSMCKCPKIHVIALDYSNNAYIKEGSRFYLAKWKKRYLVIGVPLLLLLNERELKGVIAHECGHLSKLHSRSCHRISWKIIGLKKYLDKLKKKGKPNSMIGKMVKRYVIQLNNLYFQLSKNHELEADIIAAKVVSKQTLINSLIKMEFYDGIFSRYFWRNITELNKKQEKVLEDMFFMMEKAMKGNLEIPEEVYKSFLEGIRNYYSLPGSTHPSIVERAKSLSAAIPSLEGRFNGDLISIFKDNYESTIRTLFKGEADNILHNMSIKWAELSKDRWEEYYKYITGIKTSLKDMEAIEKEKGLDSKQWLDKGFIIEELDGSDSALEVFREAEKVDKKSVAARFHIARILLQKGEEEGVEIFKAIMEEDAQLIPNCCFHVVNYYLYNNNRTEAINYYYYAVNFMNTNEEAADERASLYISDEFLLHDLSAKTLEKIKNELLRYKEVKKVYIVMKKLNLTKDFPLYIIAVKYKRFSSRKTVKSIQDDICKVLHTEEILPWDFKVVPLNGKNLNIEYDTDSILGSRII
ncbi:M48 family metalloprotease [Clostridium sp. DJ247]|uniref:M48 family metalloprotease n=1 Tax=Clostridium sp. DJ247 TaxID=2726188 RepID=UPI0016237088|nr:M48 family metalloprotease [Clostridium sp. DJ247]MBC2581680.1 M48 family metalloprotease [Clostridium sp. DJ247]